MVLDIVYSPSWGWVQAHSDGIQLSQTMVLLFIAEHDDVIKWKHFPRYWPFAREFTGHWWIPRTKASDAELNVFFDLRLNKRLSKQSLGWWFETPSCSLWRHCKEELIECFGNNKTFGYRKRVWKMNRKIISEGEIIRIWPATRWVKIKRPQPICISIVWRDHFTNVLLFSEIKALESNSIS